MAGCLTMALMSITIPDVQRDYIKEFSPSLGRDMELLHFGHAGTPLLVFPTSMGRFYQWEDFGLVAGISDYIESGAIPSTRPTSSTRSCPGSPALPSLAAPRSAPSTRCCWRPGIRPGSEATSR